MSIRTITARQVFERHQAGHHIDLLDVRTPLEYRARHATLAHNLPLDGIDPKHVVEQRGGNLREPLYIICKSGGRSGKACQLFVDAGYQNVVNVEGGTDAWCAAGLPVEIGKPAMSLERQVRVVAALIILIGAALAATVHPGWVALCAAVGAGLLHSGLTDSCAMGMLLARMPWNRTKPGATR